MGRREEEKGTRESKKQERRKWGWKARDEGEHQGMKENITKKEQREKCKKRRRRKVKKRVRETKGKNEKGEKR